MASGVDRLSPCQRTSREPLNRRCTRTVENPVMLRDAPNGAPQHERSRLSGGIFPFVLRRRAAASRRTTPQHYSFAACLFVIAAAMGHVGPVRAELQTAGRLETSRAQL